MAVLHWWNMCVCVCVCAYVCEQLSQITVLRLQQHGVCVDICEAVTWRIFMTPYGAAVKWFDIQLHTYNLNMMDMLLFFLAFSCFNRITQSPSVYHH